MKKLIILFISLIAASSNAMESDDDFCNLFQDGDNLVPQSMDFDIFFYGNNSETDTLLNDQSFLSQSLNLLPMQKFETIHSSDSQLQLALNVSLENNSNQSQFTTADMPLSISEIATTDLQSQSTLDTSSKDTKSPLQRALIKKILEKITTSICPACKTQFASSSSSSKIYHLNTNHLALYTCNRCNKKIMATDISLAATKDFPCITTTNGITTSNGCHTIIINEWSENYVKKMAQVFGIDNTSLNKIISLSNKPITIDILFSKEQNNKINEIKKKAFNCDSNCILCENNNTIYSKKSQRSHLLQQHIHPYSCKDCNEELHYLTKKRGEKLRTCQENESGYHTIISNPKRDDNIKALEDRLLQLEKPTTKPPCKRQRTK